MHCSAASNTASLLAEEISKPRQNKSSFCVHGIVSVNLTQPYSMLATQHAGLHHQAAHKLQCPLKGCCPEGSVEEQKGQKSHLMEGRTTREDPHFKQQQDVSKIAELQHVVVPVLCLVKVEASTVQHHCLDSVVLVKRLWGCSQPVSTQTVFQMQCNVSPCR